MIRPFAPYDLPEIQEIERQAFPKTAYTTTTFMTFYCRCPEGFLVWDDGGVKGYVMFMDRHVVSIAVLPDERLKGIGRSLMARAMEEKESPYVEVRASNSGAQEFYRKLGFEETGAIEGFYTDEDAIVFTYRSA